MRTMDDETGDKGQEGNTAPLQHPTPFYYSAAQNMPPMYYPPAPFYSMWGYNYPQWSQQAYTANAAAMQHVTHSDMTVNEPCDVSREDAKESGEFPDIVDSPCNVQDNNVTISPDISPASKTSEPQLSLSTLQRDYSSSSSSSAATPSPTHHHGNTNKSSPQKPLDVNSFEQQVMEFTGRRAKMIRTIKATPLNLPSDIRNTENFACMEPLEYYMQTSLSLRREKFYEVLSPDDVVLGHVEYKKSYGIHIQIDLFEGGQKHRYISDLSIQGFISLKNLASTVEDQDCLMKDLQPGDVLRAQVLRVIPDEEKVFLTLLQTDCDSSDLKLGYLERRNPPPTLRLAKEDDFNYFLARDPAFSNPHCINNLSELLGIQHTKMPSLVQQLHDVSFPDEEYYDALKKQQRRKWSMENVAIGIKHFKASEHDKAMKYLNHALEIDADNVEGLVARGALIANKGEYKKAIGDFEKALTINNRHSNAKKYLAETQAAYGKQLEETGEIYAAVKCYREALADDPELDSPKRRLNYLETQVFCRVNETGRMVLSVFEKVPPLFSPPCLWVD